MNPLAALGERIVPTTGPIVFNPWQLGAVVLIAIIAVNLRPTWLIVRLGVTLVHELGHAMTALAVGRKFTGIALNKDMSGYAVTVGPARGPGRIATTWAGYPAPAITAALFTVAATTGWSAAVFTGLASMLILAFFRLRSPLTFLVIGVALAVVVALWWWRHDTVQAHVLVVAAIILIVGSWRALAAVIRSPDPGSDPAVLAKLTGIPALLWNASFALVIAASTWVVVAGLLNHLQGAG